MSSALKPALTSAGPQNAAVPSQLNKPMHPQNATTGPYSQASAHGPQNLVSLNNPSAAHNNPAHTNTHLSSGAHQPNHYSLNVPNAPQHYNQSIPISNHPIPNAGQSQVAAQAYGGSLSKNAVFAGNYQPNLGHPPNVLPPAAPSQQQVEVTGDKPQSNGTPELKPSPNKPPTTETPQQQQQNHVTAVAIGKEKPPSPPQQEKPKAPTLLEKLPAVAITTVTAAHEPPTPPKTEAKPADISCAPVVSVTAATSTLSSSNVSPSSNSSSSPSSNAAPVVPAPSPSVHNLSVPPSGQSAVKDDAAIVSVAPAAGAGGDAESAPVAKETVAIAEPPPEGSLGKGENAAMAPGSTQSTGRDQSPAQKTSPTKSVPAPRTPRKSKTPRPEGESPKSAKSEAKVTTVQKSPGSAGKSKRTRIRTQPYQCPLPELEIISKMTSATTPKSRASDDKLIIFYKNEFLAVRNSDGGFYVCQAVQNIYKSSPKIKIRWLSQDKNEKSGEIYTPDFYDNTDFDCILTNLNLERVDKGKFRLPPAEKERTDSILKRALAVEKGDATPPSLTEEHPDGLDLSLYKEESQLQKRKGKKRKASSPMRSRSKTSATKKQPEQPKVAKVDSKKKKPKPPARKPIVVKKPAAAEPKKSAATTNLARAERAKRRAAESASSIAKTSPIVDQKKAKVLAKVARKTSQPAFKNQPVKNVKSAPIKNQKASTVQKQPPPPATRKTKRSLR